MLDNDAIASALLKKYEAEQEPPAQVTDICAFHTTVAKRNPLTREVTLNCVVQIKVGDTYKDVDFGSDHAGSVALHRVINAGVAALAEEDSK